MTLIRLIFADDLKKISAISVFFSGISVPYRSA